MLLTLTFALQGWLANLPWEKLLAGGQGILVLIILLAIVIKVAPTWKEVKIKDLSLRDHEVEVRGEEAKALTMLSGVLRDVAVEQRKATETQRTASEITELLQRVNADRSEKLATGVTALGERFDRLEKIIQVAEQNEHSDLTSRVKALECP